MNRNPLPRFLVVSLLALGALLLAGCGSSSDTGTAKEVPGPGPAAESGVSASQHMSPEAEAAMKASGGR